MKLAMVGIGDIAHKAYLPTILGRRDVELYLVTRNREVRDDVGEALGVAKSRRFSNIGDLLTQNIDAAMVHAATCSHHDIVRELLLAGVHVYVDKPLDNSYAESRQLVELAKRQGKILMVGFNRRYAPLYQEVRQDLKNPVIVLMQKNRANSPQPTRDVIFDDFIHVVDTILSMLPSPVQRWCVQGQHQGDRLTSVAVHMVAQNCAAMGMMNLMNGVDEELLEVMGTGVKWSVRELREAVKCDNQRKYQMTLDGWSTVESVKGFTGIVDAFLALVKAHDLTSAEQIVGEALETHRLCDEIVRALEGQPGPMTPLRLGR